MGQLVLVVARRQHQCAQHQGLVRRQRPQKALRRLFQVQGSAFRVPGFRVRVWDFGFRISRFRFRVSGFGLLFLGSGFRVSGFRILFLGSGFGFRVSGLGFQVSGFGFRISGFGFRVPGLEFRVCVLGFGVWVACDCADSAVSVRDISATPTTPHGGGAVPPPFSPTPPSAPPSPPDAPPAPPKPVEICRAASRAAVRHASKAWIKFRARVRFRGLVGSRVRVRFRFRVSFRVRHAFFFRPGFGTPKACIKRFLGVQGLCQQDSFMVKTLKLRPFLTSRN